MFLVDTPKPKVPQITSIIQQFQYASLSGHLLKSLPLALYYDDHARGDHRHHDGTDCRVTLAYRMAATYFGKYQSLFESEKGPDNDAYGNYWMIEVI